MALLSPGRQGWEGCTAPTFRHRGRDCIWGMEAPRHPVGDQLICMAHRIGWRLVTWSTGPWTRKPFRASVAWAKGPPGISSLSPQSALDVTDGHPAPAPMGYGEVGGSCMAQLVVLLDW